MGYNWCWYYRKAYEKKKKENIILAGKVADAEGKREELQAKYAAICANPLYKMTRPLYLVKRGCGKIVRKAGRGLRGGRGALTRGMGNMRSGGGTFSEDAESMRLCERGSTEKVTPEKLLASYRERLAFQRDSYRQWIREEEPVIWRQCEESLQAEKSRTSGERHRRCAVVSYRELAGITDLAPVMGRGKEVGNTAENNFGENRSEEREIRPDILLFAEKPEELDEKAVSYIEDWFMVHPGTKLFYGAEDHLSTSGKRSFPWFKPCLSTDTLLGFFYFGSYFAVDTAWAEKVKLSGYADAKENLYDFTFRLLEPYFKMQKGDKNRDNVEDGISSKGISASNIVCSDLILYHRNTEAVSEMGPDREYFLHTGEMNWDLNPEFWGYERKYTGIKQKFIDNICYKIAEGEAEEKEIEENLRYHAFSYQTLHPEVWSVVPDIAAEIEKAEGTLVSVVIPSKDHPELLKKCIGSFLERTALARMQRVVEFIVVDNGSKEENRQTIQAFLESVKVECHYIYRPMPFNFSAMCNIGAAQAKGEYILLLNDDMEIIEENWLRILLGQALLPGTGAVGAKLWYPEEERIQHAGITNMHIGPSHKLVTFPDDRIYYYGHNAVTYDMIAVTAACLLVKKAIYQEVGGLDEDMAVAYNDVDFCFKTAEAGYRNVIRNDAVLLHHESASRGLDELSSEKWLRLLREKEKLYKKHPLFYKQDPYYSEQLADHAPDYRIGYQYPFERRLLTAEPVRQEGKGELQKMLSGMVMLTVERTGDQHKIHMDEPDILETEGWCYILDQDNCLFERWLILEAEQGDCYYRVPVRERLRPDVEAILPQQKNIELSGFTCRILKESIAAGDYRVGMLYRNVLNGRLFYQSSDARLAVTE